jgi:hypothetical protein
MHWGQLSMYNVPRGGKETETIDEGMTGQLEDVKGAARPKVLRLCKDKMQMSGDNDNEKSSCCCVVVGGKACAGLTRRLKRMPATTGAASEATPPFGGVIR